jgi:type IV secretion system protein VirD4
MSTFLEAFENDIPRGITSRYLKHETQPQARWQPSEAVMASETLRYDPRDPGRKILVGAQGH